MKSQEGGYTIKHVHVHVLELNLLRSMIVYGAKFPITTTDFKALETY